MGENKKKLRTIYPKNHEDFKNSKPRIQFYWFKKKRIVSSQCYQRLEAIQSTSHKVLVNNTKAGYNQFLVIVNFVHLQ